MDPNRQGAEPTRPSKNTRADRRWTLLFLGSRGKTVTFRHFKAVVFAAVMILLASTAVSLWFWSVNRNVRSENLTLRKEIDNMKQAVASVRKEKDILTARLVVAESRVAELMEKTGPAEKTKEKQVSKAKSDNRKKTALSIAKKPEPPLSVDVDNFIVFFEPDINTLRVEYKLRNTGRKGNPVSGRTLVILKEDEDNPEDWLVMPNVALEDNRPKGNGGMYFSIYRFRTVRFKANDQIGPDQYKSATVFVFSSKGTLLLEKEFPVGIQSKTLTIVEPAPQRSQAAKPKAPVPQEQKPKPPPAPPPSSAASTDAAPDASSANDPPPPEEEVPPEIQIRLP